jgi:hypothetical protein
MFCNFSLAKIWMNKVETNTIKKHKYSITYKIIVQINNQIIMFQQVRYFNVPRYKKSFSLIT